jgi:flagellar biosynthesis/type III secretory pathway chaperone
MNEEMGYDEAPLSSVNNSPYNTSRYNYEYQSSSSTAPPAAGGTASSTTPRNMQIHNELKKTINKIDQQMSEDVEIFNQPNGNINLNNEAARKIILLERAKLLAAAAQQQHQRNKSVGSAYSHSSHNNYQTNSGGGGSTATQFYHHSSSLPPPQHRNNLNYSSSGSNSMHYNNAGYQSRATVPCYVQTAYQTQINQNPQRAQPRRSYSSCAEPIGPSSARNYNEHRNQSVFVATGGTGETRHRSISNRSSPSRPSPPYIINTNGGVGLANMTNMTNSNSFNYSSAAAANTTTTTTTGGNCLYKEIRRSRSIDRRKSKSKSPVQQYYRREIKINLGASRSSPPPALDDEEYHQQLINDEIETKTVTTTTTTKPPPPPPPIVQPQPIKHTTTLTSSFVQQQDVQEEVLLNLFSCNNSGSISSESSESLVELNEERKLKINEVYEKTIKEQPPEKKEIKMTYTQQQMALEKRLAELEKKLQKLPELEIKNNILLEEKQLLVKQLLNIKQQKESPPPPAPEPAKLYRSIGCNSTLTMRDVGVECRTNTRDIGITSVLDEPPREEIAHMQTIITTLRDKLNEQTLIMQQQLQKPSTRDVAVMHVVDKVEEAPPPKPELRDVAINHRTEVDEKEFIEKQKLIINTYIKETEQLRLENAKLNASLEEFIKKNTKHVITRGTYAPEQPVLYSVGTNTDQVSMRDVQLMFTPKVREVALGTDTFYNHCDVGLTCTLGYAEQETQIRELIAVKKKYEEIIEESLKPPPPKPLRDVGVLCDLNQKEYRSISLECNLEEHKQMRQVGLMCKLDDEVTKCDVNISCKPEQHDAWIYVNTIEPIVVEIERRVERRDFSTVVHIEDQEKVRMAQELAMLKMVPPKVTRDVAVSFDQRTRLMDDFVRNRSSSMEQLKTYSRQVNTEARHVRDMCVSTSKSRDDLYISDKSCQIQLLDIVELEASRLQKEQIERERNKLITMNSDLREQLTHLESQLTVEKRRFTEMEIRNKEYVRQQQQQQQTQVVVGLVGRISASTSTTNLNEYTIKKESEYEQHKTTRIDSCKKTQQENAAYKTTVLDSRQVERVRDEKGGWSTITTVNFGAHVNLQATAVPITSSDGSTVTALVTSSNTSIRGSSGSLAPGSSSTVRNEISIPMCANSDDLQIRAPPTNKSNKVIMLNKQSASSSAVSSSTGSLAVPCPNEQQQQYSEHVVYETDEVVERKSSEK